MKTIRDNRKFPRVEHSCDVTLKLPGNRNIKTAMFDISPDGLQIHFNKETAIIVTPVLGDIIKNSSCDLDAEFSMNSGNTSEKIITGCKPIYLHKIEKGVYAMGLQFNKIDDRYKTILESFIETSMEPPA